MTISSKMDEYLIRVTPKIDDKVQGFAITRLGRVEFIGDYKPDSVTIQLLHALGFMLRVRPEFNNINASSR